MKTVKQSHGELEEALKFLEIIIENRDKAWNEARLRRDLDVLDARVRQAEQEVVNASKEFIFYFKRSRNGILIYFKNIRWKNLLSTGNQFTEIQLNKSSTTLIVGDNGSGKSTVLDALCFGLFNKPFRRINRPQLVNSINDGGLLVEIEFDYGSKSYKVRRGIKKNIFEIYVEGKKIKPRC